MPANRVGSNEKERFSEDGGRPPQNLSREQITAYREKILKAIETDPIAHRFLLKLTTKHKFNADEIVGGLLDNIFHDQIGRRERLLASPTLPDSVREHMKYPSPGEWKAKNSTNDDSIAASARELAGAIERAEIDTPEFGLDQLDHLKRSPESDLTQLVQDLNKLPATLRLYADYFEKSRGWWRIIGRIENDARTKFQKAVRDLLQEQIKARTGHYSDERYYRLLNIALNVLGLPGIERNALTMRRVRRRARPRQDQ